MFGRYRIVREVGTGGMGSVYEAVLVDLNKRVALKVLSPDLADHREHRERFVREGRAAARIRHANVVEIFDVGEHDGLPFLAMEFLVGQDLRARYDAGPIRPAELLDLVIPVIAAVTTAHDAQVIHRDLKPENIFLNERPGQGVQPVVLDFGISKVTDDSAGENLTATSTMVGTPLYMSPEQVRRSREVDPRTDQYALGVLLYEGLSGVSAFSGDSLYDLLIKKVEGEFAPLRTVAPGLPEELCSAIERAMSADRDKRFPDLRAFARALLPFARERTRAQWAASFAPPRAASESGEAAGGAGEGRADSTLRSSVRELPALAQTRRLTRGVGAGAAVLVVALGIWLVSGPWRGAPADREGEVHTVAPQPVAAAAVPAQSSPQKLPERFTVHVTAEPPTARIALDGEPAGVGTITREFAKDGTPHTLEISADGFETRRITFTDRAPDEREVRLIARSEPAPEPGEAASERAPAAPPAATPPRSSRPERSARRPAVARPGSPQPAEPEPPSTREAQRRVVGSNDAPVLY